jgi:hypothetical protein
VAVPTTPAPSTTIFMSRPLGLPGDFGHGRRREIGAAARANVPIAIAFHKEIPVTRV